MRDVETSPKDVVMFATNNGKVPFSDWFDGLRDKQVKKNIVRRIGRVQTGNYGDYKSLGDGVFELRFHFGTRVYFAEVGNTVVLLLSGGDKSSQFKDVSKAKEYFSEYKFRCYGGERLWES